MPQRILQRHTIKNNHGVCWKFCEDLERCHYLFIALLIIYISSSSVLSLNRNGFDVTERFPAMKETYGN